MALTVVLPPSVVPVSAAFDSGNGAADRTLYLHHTHTGETGRFTFKRNGQYDQAVLRPQFGTELKALGAALSQRISREEQSLFPLYQPRK